MSRALYNAVVIPEVVELIAQRYRIPVEEALDRFYTSETASALNDPETGLYGQSALFLFSQYLAEKEAK